MGSVGRDGGGQQSLVTGAVVVGSVASSAVSRGEGIGGVFVVVEVYGKARPACAAMGVRTNGLFDGIIAAVVRAWWVCYAIMLL